MKASDLEWWLVKKGVVTNSELDEDPRVTEVEEGGAGGGRKGVSRAAVYASERGGLVDDDDE